MGRIGQLHDRFLRVCLGNCAVRDRTLGMDIHQPYRTMAPSTHTQFGSKAQRTSESPKCCRASVSALPHYGPVHPYTVRVKGSKNFRIPEVLPSISFCTAGLACHALAPNDVGGLANISAKMCMHACVHVYTHVCMSVSNVRVRTGMHVSKCMCACKHVGKHKYTSQSVTEEGSISE